MTELRFETVPADGGDDLHTDWQHVHNLIIPTAPLSAAEVRERAGRNRLTVTYRKDVLVGCSTVRPPVDEQRTATVIVRVLPAFRRQGIGAAMHAEELAAAYRAGAKVIETVVLAANTDGLRFAEQHGYAEFDRYTLDGDTIPFVDLRLTHQTP